MIQHRLRYACLVRRGNGPHVPDLPEVIKENHHGYRGVVLDSAPEHADAVGLELEGATIGSAYETFAPPAG